MNDDIHGGGCMCGAIRYRVGGRLSAMAHCHCSDCRKTQGADFATNTTVDPEELQLDDPSGLLCAYPSSPG